MPNGGVLMTALCISCNGRYFLKSGSRMGLGCELFGSQDEGSVLRELLVNAGSEHCNIFQ